jgi:hypothetical protein
VTHLVLHDLTVEEVHGALRVPGVSGIVGDHADRGAPGVKLPEKVHHRFTVHRIQVSGGLVGEEHRGLATDGPRHCDPLLLTRRRAARDSASADAPYPPVPAKSMTRSFRSPAGMFR